jgi:hypothetical protein
MRQLSKLPKNRSTYLAVSVDEGSRIVDLKENHVYSATEYFAENKEEYKKTPIGCILDGIEYVGEVFADRGDGWASIGKGDANSMTWEDLLKMPSIIHHDDEEESSENEEDEEEEEEEL